MKKLKQAIATFILQGKDCWNKLNWDEKDILYVIFKEECTNNPYITYDMVRYEIKNSCHAFLRNDYVSFCSR